MHSSIALSFTFFSAVFADTCYKCQSFGVDFIEGGSYFQNSLSPDNFTAVQNFEGCTNDTTHNVLVAPRGRQYECSMTPMQPDDAPQMLTCPIEKDHMHTGEWSLLILSNNGDCDPIDYQRDFYLSVGPQQTTTVSPTCYVSSTTTPVESDTVTSTQTVTYTASPSTTTVPRATFTPTITIHPKPSITVVTKAVYTVTKRKQSANIVATTTATKTATCKRPNQPHRADPLAKIVATVLGDLDVLGLTGLPIIARAEPTAGSATHEFKRAIIEDRAVEPQVKERYLRERHERLALQKRAPDQPTATVTDPYGTPVTSTTTYTASTTTVTGTTTEIDTVTTTPIVTVSSGVSVRVSTVTAPTKTITNTFWVPATTVYSTRTQDVTLTITTTVTPTRVAKRCSRIGGVLSH